MPSYGRVSQQAFKVIISVFFAVAMSAAASRCAIRLWYLKRLRVDDYLLLVSCIFLSAATGVLLYGTPSIFFAAELTFNPIASFQGIDEAEIVSKANEIPKINWSYLALSWTAIFMIKFGFLALFRQLVDRVAQIYTFWKGVVVFTTLVMAFAICDGFIACSKTGLAAAQCSATTGALRKSLAIGTTAIVLDMLTDIFILAIPVWLLWRVRMKLRQKLGLATFLCLSVSMIVMAIVRVSGIHYHGKFDNPWIFMWQQMEACVAVSMLSLTSFRVFFVGPNSSPERANHWVPSTRRVLAKRKKGTSADQCLDDTPIPFATLTGLSGFFDRSRPAKSTDESTMSDTWPLSDRQQEVSTHV